MPVFLFTDIEGSTRMWEKYASVMGGVIARHDEILQGTIVSAGGRITKHTGDGITAAFEGGQPLTCAVNIQRRLGAVPWGEIGELRVRIGLHGGEAELYQAPGMVGGDYFGPAVNCTARIMSAAWGGQILLTPQVTSRTELPEQAELLDLGEHLLKDVGTPQPIYQLLHPDLLCQSFPPLRTLSGSAIQRAVDQQGEHLASLEPTDVAVSLVAATLVPALQGNLSPTSPALTANLGLLGDLGAGTLRNWTALFASRLRDRQQAGQELVPRELQRELATELRREWGANEALRADASRLLQAVEGIEAALTAASTGVRPALAQSLTALGGAFVEFRWVLDGVQASLDEVRVTQDLQLGLQEKQMGLGLAQLELQREQLALQQEQMARTEELLERLEDAGSLGRSLRDLAVPVERPAFLEGEAEEAPPPLFVARKRELGFLDGLLSKALAGEGQVAFVTGGPGRGKSALLDAFARRAMEAHPDLLVALGTCNAHAGIGDAYLPFREVMAMLTADVEARWEVGVISTDHARRLWANLPQAVEALLNYGPHLIDIFCAGPPLLGRAMVQAPARAPWLRRLRHAVERAQKGAEELGAGQLLEQYCNVLRSLAGARPLVLVLEDLQWADDASISLLFHLGRRLEGVPILVAGDYRPEEVALGRKGERHPLDKVLAEFKRQFGDVWLDLSGVEEDEGREFVNALLDSEDNCLDEAFRDNLFEHTEGHPLFTVELLRAMQERGDLVRDEAQCWIAGPSLDWHRLPMRVEGVIEERVNRLEEGLRDILTVASVEGEEFTAQVVARVENLGERQLLKTLSRDLEKRHRLVREQGAVRLGRQRLSRYRFAHALFQRYLYQELGEGERALLHGDVADVLEQLYVEHPAELEALSVEMAHHYAMAGDEERELVYTRLAGERAAARMALVEAETYLSRALELAPEEDLPARYGLLLARQAVYRELGEPEREEQDQEALEVLAPALGAGKQAEVAVRRARIAQRAGDSARTLEAVQAALEWARAAGNVALEIDALRTMAFRNLHLAEYGAALAEAHEALTLAQNAGLRVKEADVLLVLGGIVAFQGDIPTSARYNEEALALYREQGNRLGELLALQGLVESCAESGELARARDLSLQGLRQARQTGRRDSREAMLHNLGAICEYTGDYTRAVGYLEQVLDSARERRHQREIINSLGNVGMLLYLSGDYDRALAHLEQAVTQGRKTGVLYHLGFQLNQLGHTLAALDRPEEAAAAYGEALEVVHESKLDHLAMGSLAGLARLALSQEEPEQALGHVEPILAILRAGGSPSLNTEPVRIYLTCYRVLRACGDPRAGEVLEEGYRNLQDRAALIGDEELERSFLEKVPWHRELIAEYETKPEG
jgi:adenylate cyclase